MLKKKDFGFFIIFLTILTLIQTFHQINFINLNKPIFVSNTIQVDKKLFTLSVLKKEFTLE